MSDRGCAWVSWWLYSNC